MEIRRAKKEDIPGIEKLLSQVNLVHHLGRPDLFRIGRKYTSAQLEEILRDEERPVFVMTDDAGEVAGHAFCVFMQPKDDNILTDIKTLYIDDICVDENHRRGHIGRQLYDHVKRFAKGSKCYNITLNVWASNTAAARFYESCGLKPQKVTMEELL